MPFKRWISRLPLIAATTLTAMAQDAFPSRPIRIIVTFPPGGGPDIMARSVAAKISTTIMSRWVTTC